MAVTTNNIFILQSKIFISFRKRKAGVHIEEKLLDRRNFACFQKSESYSLREETAYG